MGLRFIIERLIKREIQYELKLRNEQDQGTVIELRNKLRKILRRENTEGASVSLDGKSHLFNFDEEVFACEEGLNSLETLIKAFEVSPNKATALTIETKLSHYISRANYLQVTPDNEVNEKLKQKLVIELAMMMSRYQLLITKCNSDGSSSDEESKVKFNASNIQLSAEKVKSIPVSKWNIQFSGESKSLSLGAFLERVNELRVARNVTYEQLFAGSIDLFTGKALLWLRANRNTVNNWNELVELLRVEFQPINYDERLMEEIKRRTQGPDESIGIYVAIMKNMFSRLAEPVSEIFQLNILSRNIAPFYQTQLALVEFNTIKDLLVVGRKIEERRYAIENYVPPTRKKTDLETDLSYLNSTSENNPNELTLDSCSTPLVTSTPNESTVKIFGPTDRNNFPRSNENRSFSRPNNNFPRANNNNFQRSNPNNFSRPKNLNNTFPRTDSNNFARTTNDTRSAKVMTCWNCNSTQHLARECNEPKRKMYCYRCGLPDFTVNTCPKCSQSPSRGKRSEN